MNKPIATALLSYGMSGQVFHAPLIAALPEFKLLRIVQRSSDAAGKDYPFVHTSRSVEEAIDDAEVELVVVNTPNETHFDFTSRALSAGKHVVVEKPFTVTSAEALALIQLAQEKNLLLTVFQNRRWDADFLTVKEVIKNKKLGRIVEFEVHYDRFRNYVEKNTWKEEATPGTGILYNLGSHTLDQVLQLFGAPNYVDARIGARRPGGMVDDFFDIRLEYEGMLVIVKSCYLVKEPGPRYIIHGMNGSFVKYGLDPQEQALKEKQSPLKKHWGEEPAHQWGKINILEAGETVEESIPSLPGDYLAFYRNLFRAIRLNEPLAVQPQEALDVIRLIEACYESSKKKMAVSFQPRKG